MPSIEAWIKEGMDPVHAAYAFVQHITSHFSEGVSQLPEMKEFAKIVAKAEDESLLFALCLLFALLQLLYRRI